MAMPQNEEDPVFEKLVKNADAELAGRTTTRAYSGEVGACSGCVLGPITVFALLWLDALIHPDTPSGGPLGWLFVLVVAAVLGSSIGGWLIPLCFKGKRGPKNDSETRK